MALLFMDGFDHYAAADLAKKWDYVGGSVTISANGANGTNGVSFSSDGISHELRKNLPANLATVIVGVSMKPAAATNYSADWGFMEFYDGGTVQVRLHHAADGTITALRGNVSLGTSVSNALPPNIHSYLEVKVTISDTVGTIEVRVNGVTVINLTGQDTQVSANAYVNMIEFSGSVNSGWSYMDDIYICDTNGGVNDNFLGTVRVKTLVPTAEGTNTGWTPLSGTDNALMVDEASQDSDTTYNYTDTTNARDTYVMGDIASLGGSVYGVAVNVTARKEGDVARKIKTTLKSGATYALGAEETLAATYDIYQTMHNTNPDGSVAWTETTVNAIEAGVDLTA